MATKSTHPTSGQDAKADEADTTTEQQATAPTVPALRYLVTYPSISIVWTTDDGVEERVIPAGQYLDQHVPADIIAEKARQLMAFGHVQTVSSRQ